MGRMRKRWLGRDYSLLRWNCLDFAQEMCQELGVCSLPSYVDALPRGFGNFTRIAAMRPIMLIHGFPCVPCLQRYDRSASSSFETQAVCKNLGLATAESSNK